MKTQRLALVSFLLFMIAVLILFRPDRVQPTFAEQRLANLEFSSRELDNIELQQTLNYPSAHNIIGNKSLIAQMLLSEMYANSVINYQVFGTNNTHTDENTVLGTPCKGTNQDLSLGGGWLIVDMGSGEEIIDAVGNDLKVYESEDNPNCNGGGASPYAVFVSNSSNGPWISIGNGNGVSEFDISSSGFASIRYIRVEDRSSGQPDSSTAPGADIAGFEALHIATYTISGRVADANNTPVAGVAVSAGSGGSATTNLSGVYTLTNLISGTYTLSPTLGSYVFSPTQRLVWVPPDRGGQDFVETLISCPATQWLAQYYNNRDLQNNPILTRCDQNIDFYWGPGAPHISVFTDNFSVRWQRTVEISTPGWYHFRGFTDDGLRLYVDRERIIDDWTARSFTEKSALKKLTQGTHQVTMEYVEWSNDAMAHLTWYRSLLCPDNAIACSLNFTPMYQTQYLDKNSFRLFSRKKSKVQKNGL